MAFDYLDKVTLARDDSTSLRLSLNRNPIGQKAQRMGRIELGDKVFRTLPATTKRFSGHLRPRRVFVCVCVTLGPARSTAARLRRAHHRRNSPPPAIFPASWPPVAAHLRMPHVFWTFSSSFKSDRIRFLGHCLPGSIPDHDRCPLNMVTL